MFKISAEKIDELFALIGEKQPLYLPVDNNTGKADFKRWEKGTKLSKIPGPENGGLFLYAWCTDSALKKQYRFNTTPINDNLTFYSTSISKIYVPREAVEEYKSKWSKYANSIVAYDFE